jgi:peptidoglycan hydrolase CwlO-like protein
MTQAEKAERYDTLVREGDKVQHKMSRLQSQNAGINTKSDEYDAELNGYRRELAILESEMAKLFIE